MTIYHTSTYEFGETDWFFDSVDAPITNWSMNDAQWRPEYMAPLMKAAGVIVMAASEAPAKARRLMLATIRKDLKENGATAKDLRAVIL